MRLGLRRWISLALAPTAWALFFFVAWAFPAALCDVARWPLHLAAAATVVATAAGLALTAVDVRRSTHGGGPVAFVLTIGAMLAALLVVGAAWGWAFVFAVDPCQ